MWFKNLSLYRFTEDIPFSETQLQEKLDSFRFRPCGSLELFSYGWTAPLPGQDDLLVHNNNGFWMICARKEEKILPATVINEFLQERVGDIEDRELRKVRKKEKDSIRDEIIHDLLPKAFSYSRRTYAYIDSKGKWLIVDASSNKKSDDLVSYLRKSLDALPVIPPVVNTSPTAMMTQWLTENQPAAQGIILENECELRSPEEDGGIVRCKRQDLFSPEIESHLKAGKEVIKLALTWNDRLSFVIDEHLSIKRLRFLDLIQEEAANIETDSDTDRFDADFAIMSLELARFLPKFFELFGGEDIRSHSSPKISVSNG